MDSAIQSLVQSPFMRTMASIPTKSEWLVHGVTDHTPPISKQRVVLNPVVGSTTTPNTTFQFDIPRVGLLRRCTLRVVLIPSSGAPFPAWIKARQHVLDYANCVQNIELFSKQRFLERLAPAAIPWEMTHVEKLRDEGYGFSYGRSTQGADGLLTYSSSVGDPNILNTTSTSAIVYTGQTPSRRIGWHLPLPFCSLSSLRKNFQTFFIEQLSVHVTTALLPTHQTSDGSYQLQLVCDYHQYHPNVETMIRNANFKQGVPATLPWYDWIKFDRRISARDVGQASAVIPYEGIAYSLESDALISEMLIVPKCEGLIDQEPNQVRAALLSVTRNYYVVITANGDTLYESSFFDAITHSGKPAVVDEDSAYPFWPLDRNHQTSHAYMPILLGLQKKREQFTGGLALSSLVNARITIYPSEAVFRRLISAVATDPGAATFPNYEKAGSVMEFDIYAKRHFLMRIDSDTGVVTRTIEA